MKCVIIAIARDRVQPPLESPYPLNSRRLTGAYLRFVAKAIDLPMSGSVDETRAMISGKLEQMGRDPRNVQIVVRRDPSGQESLLLVDMDGTFIDAGVMEETGRSSACDRGADRRDKESDSTSSDRGSPTLDECAELRTENAALIAWNTALTKDVSYLKGEVAKVNDKTVSEYGNCGEGTASRLLASTKPSLLRTMK